jgi:hypothetical protein
MAGWKPGDPPRGRRLRAVPPPVEPPLKEKPTRRRRRPLSSQTAAGGSGVEPGGRQEERQPRQKVRLGERWTDIVRSVKAGEYTWQEFVESLDDKEVARCQLMDAAGRFTGRPPSIVPREFALAAARELKRRFEQIFKDEVTGIAKQYVELAKDDSIPAKDRAKMMQYAMERIFGAIPKEIFISQEAPWESVVTTVVAESEQEAPPIDRYAGREQGNDDA